MLWTTHVKQVIAELTGHQTHLGKPPCDAASNDPRKRLHRALTYFTNNASHMYYPEYHSQGLPLTSSHIESKVKLINCRIKGTETFWLREDSECVLQLRADYLGLSDLVIRPAIFTES